MNAQTFFPSGKLLLKSNSFYGEGMVFELGGVFTVAAMLFCVSSKKVLCQNNVCKIIIFHKGALQHFNNGFMQIADINSFMFIS